MAETKKKTTTTRKKKTVAKKPVVDTGAMKEFVEAMTGKPVSEIKVDLGSEEGDKTVTTVYAKLEESIDEIDVNMDVYPVEEKKEESINEIDVINDIVNNTPIDELQNMCGPVFDDMGNVVVGGDNAPIPGKMEGKIDIECPTIDNGIYTKPEAAEALTEVLKRAVDNGETAMPLPEEIDDMVRQEHEDLIEGKEQKIPIRIVNTHMGINYD